MVESLEERAERLRERIRDAEHRLHVLEHPSASRRALERLVDELEALEARGAPAPPGSPTVRRGGPPASPLALRPHPVPWPDLPAIHGAGELRAHHARVVAAEGGEATFVATATVQGVEVLLRYVGGALEQGLLRGDGLAGEDVTANVRAIGSVPLRLRQPGSVTESRVTKLTRQALGPATITPVPPFPTELVVRGHVAVRSADLTALDRQRVDAGEAPYVTPRAAVVGGLRRLDPRVTASRPLRFFALDVATPVPGIDSAWQELGALKSWGFAVVPAAWRVRGLQELFDFVAALQQLASGFEYPLGGAVVRVNRVGAVDRRREADAPSTVRLAFPAPGRLAQVTRVYHAVGRSGAVLPVALLARAPDQDLPVPERAPVPPDDHHGFLAVRQGGLARVRPGTVAPVLSLDQPAPAEGAPSACPSCGAGLAGLPDEPFRTCPSPGCLGRARSRLLHLVGPRGLRLNTLGVKVVDRLLAELGPLDLPDVLLLDPGRVDRIAPGAGAAFAEELARVQRLPLWRVLYLAGIPHVGERAARVVAQQVLTLDRLESLAPEDCARLPDLWPEAAAGLAEFMTADGPRLLLRLRQTGVAVEDGPGTFPAPFLGRTVVVAGELDLGAVHAADEIERRGGVIQARVGRTTDLLVAGRDAAREADAAAVYSVATIDERALRAVLEQADGAALPDSGRPRPAEGPRA